MSPPETELPKPYDADRCEQCGTCLMLCPVMKLSGDQAREEIRALRAGKPGKALYRCTTCFACDFLCPNSCNPGGLILENWDRITSERGLPERARYFLPHSSPNFRTYVVDRMSPRERAIIASWKDMTPAKEVCYPGCNMVVTPLLTQTKALEGLDIRGGLEWCCGEMYFRTGLFDQLRQVAKKTSEYFDALGAEKVTILCSAGYYMFTRVLPRFGGEYSFTMEPYLALLKRRLDSGEIEFTRPLGMRVTIQESCYGKQFGEEYMALPREILERAGCEVVEMENSRECMMCCGIGAGFSPGSAFNPVRMTFSTLGLLRQARKTGADAVAVYCSGCLQMFSTGLLLYPGLPVYHLLQLVGMAMGETPDFSTRRFAMRMLAGTARNQFPSLLSRHRFTPGDIEGGAGV